MVFIKLFLGFLVSLLCIGLKANLKQRQHNSQTTCALKSLVLCYVFDLLSTQWMDIFKTENFLKIYCFGPKISYVKMFPIFFQILAPSEYFDENFAWFCKIANCLLMICSREQAFFMPSVTLHPLDQTNWSQLFWFWRYWQFFGNIFCRFSRKPWNLERCKKTIG